MDSMTGAEVAGIDGIAHSIVAAACRLLGTPVGFLILDGANGSASVHGSVGLPAPIDRSLVDAFVHAARDGDDIVRIADACDAIGGVAEAARALGIRSLLLAPMPAGSSEIGVLLAGGWTPCDFTFEQASILEVLAEQAASRLGSHRHLTSEQAERRRTRALLDVAQVVTRSPDLDTALTGICRAASKLSVAHQCTIFLDDGGGRPRPVTGWNQVVGLDGAHLDHFRSFQTMLLQERRAASLDELAAMISTLPLVLDDAAQAPIAIRPWVDEFNIKSLAIYPLLARQGSVGVMNLTAHDRPVHFSADEIEAMSAIALQAAAVIEHLRLLEQVRRQAERDGLTGLYNRRVLTDALQREFDATMRNGNPLAVILLDVDGMKRLNDSRGHAAGDMHLQRVAAALTATFRLTDIIARYGGDEFLVLMPATDGATAVDLGRQFLSVIASEETGVGASIGIAVAPEDAETAADLLSAADAAMYTAKRSGYGGIALARDRLMASE